MKRILLFLVLWVPALCGFAVPDEQTLVNDTKQKVLPPAQQLLDEVIRALPAIPLQINGTLQSKTTDGKTDRKMQLEMLLDWQAQPPQARYTIRDNFGRPLKFLSVTWPAGAEPEYHFMQGDPLVGAPLPPLGEQIEETDITWIDLSLSFLRWKNGRTSGGEEVRGRDCYVVDIDAPKGTPGYSGVRLWLEPKIHILLRAESYNEKVELMRRLDVKSFKKINDRWFVGEIELQSFPSKHRTYLRVQSVYDRERKQYLSRDTAAGDEQAQPTNQVMDKIEIPATTTPPPVK